MYASECRPPLQTLSARPRSNPPWSSVSPAQSRVVVRPAEAFPNTLPVRCPGNRPGRFADSPPEGSSILWRRCAWALRLTRQAAMPIPRTPLLPMSSVPQALRNYCRQGRQLAIRRVLPRRSEFYFSLKPQIHWRFYRQNQRHSRPTRTGGGDPLIGAVRESAFEITLNRKRTRLNQPRAVIALGAEQKPDSAPVGRILHWNAARLMKRDQRLASRIGVAF